MGFQTQSPYSGQAYSMASMNSLTPIVGGSSRQAYPLQSISPIGEMPLASQKSIYSLTLEEFQNTLGEPGKSFGSMNMEELLKNIWTAEEGQAMATAMGTADVDGTGICKQASLQRQGSLSVRGAICLKTVDEVWITTRACLSHTPLPRLTGRAPARSGGGRSLEVLIPLHGRTSMDRPVPCPHWISKSPVGAHFRSRQRTGSNTFAAAAAHPPYVDVDLMGDGIADDYYSVLGVPIGATPEEIKKAYYSCMKSCHPDLAGENAETTTFCMFINEVYEVLSDPVQRMVYDEINGYSLTSINPFLDLFRPQDHVFVDEFSCIGCKNCANTASKTFEIEEDFGRARVVSQCGRVSAVQRAIDTCPVDCIHWVTAAQLSLLEDEMRRIERVNVGVMLSGMGRMSADVFGSASWRWEKKQARAVEAAKIRMMKEKSMKESGPWWQNMWNQSVDGTESQGQVDPEVQERAAKAAAAARRWREYSRKGVDRRPIYNLPSNFTSDSDEESETRP